MFALELLSLPIRSYSAKKDAVGPPEVSNFCIVRIVSVILSPFARNSVYSGRELPFFRAEFAVEKGRIRMVTLLLDESRDLRS